MIDVHDLTKTYRGKVVVDRLSFTVEPGRVTGFLGPNGAGKSTTMRLIVGLDHPSEGTATIDGRRYAELSRPLMRVGALLDAEAVHPGRSAYDHLLFLPALFGWVLMEFGDFAMLRAMLRGIKQRAEQPRAAHVTGEVRP